MKEKNQRKVLQYQRAVAAAGKQNGYPCMHGCYVTRWCGDVPVLGQEDFATENGIATYDPSIIVVTVNCDAMCRSPIYVL